MFKLHEWHPEARRKLTELGFEDGQEIFEDRYIVAKKLFEAGLNVMLFHTREQGDVLFVDTRRFSQR